MNNACSFCGMYDENLEHLFCICRKVTQLWDNIQQWMNNKLGVNLVITNLMKLQDYLLNDQTFWPLHLILMITWKYIFWCAKNNYKLNIFFLQKETKKTYLEQETLSLINSQSTQFERRWNIWKHIFDGIDR